MNDAAAEQSQVASLPPDSLADLIAMSSKAALAWLKIRKHRVKGWTSGAFDLYLERVFGDLLINEEDRQNIADGVQRFLRGIVPNSTYQVEAIVTPVSWPEAERRIHVYFAAFEPETDTD